MEDKSTMVQLPAWTPQQEQHIWGNRTLPLLLTPGCVALPTSSHANGELLSTGVVTPSAESLLRSPPRFSQPQFDGQQPELVLSREEPLEEDQGPQHTRKFSYNPGQVLQQTVRLCSGGAVDSSRSEATTKVTSPASPEEIECCPPESKVLQQQPSMVATVLAEAASLAVGHLQRAASTVATEHLLGSPLMPTVGSSGHFAGACNPLRFCVQGLPQWHPMPVLPLVHARGEEEAKKGVKDDSSSMLDSRRVAVGHLQRAASTVATEHLLGSPLMPTVGSSGHFAGTCSPCVFAFKGCHSGIQCQFCHLCMRGEKKRRKRASKMLRRVGWTPEGWPSLNTGWDSSTNS
eukprot:CAMPEP_0172931028 /NCGR_PEP_ID=MMETSP1075-20121228/219288_1 /TAXON_ID=2916 /ORGANISM="Ceratium fusus, Strain PA161109" /LENGTH=346 /DNA_ID=CAMNT_0013792341 /DNA_START=59 /DNA_END=1098 /DNA_ORIENTATION=+